MPSGGEFEKFAEWSALLRAVKALLRELRQTRKRQREIFDDDDPED